MDVAADPDAAHRAPAANRRPVGRHLAPPAERFGGAA
jgi:hypothetical protein